MIKAIVLGMLGLIVGMFLVSKVILPFASVLLARPDIDTWTGLGALLRMLGLVLLGALYAGYLVHVYNSRHADE